MGRSQDELAKMRRAGRVVAEMHACIREAIRPGVTTADLDRIGREVIERRGARSNFLGYGNPPFRGVICASPNDVIVHGIPGPEQLEEGDIISIDCGAIVDGWHGDAAFTAPVGTAAPEALALIEATEPLVEALNGFGPAYTSALTEAVVARLSVVSQGFDADAALVNAAFHGLASGAESLRWEPLCFD